MGEHYGGVPRGFFKLKNETAKVDWEPHLGTLISSEQTQLLDPEVFLTAPKIIGTFYEKSCHRIAHIYLLFLVPDKPLTCWGAMKGLLSFAHRSPAPFGWCASNNNNNTFTFTQIPSVITESVSSPSCYGLNKSVD